MAQDDVGDYWNYHSCMQAVVEVDTDKLMQPVGFVWFKKPVYRVRAITRKIKEK